MYHKWQSYDVWFLRYRTRQTEFLVTLDSPFTPLTTRKIKILKKWENYLEILSFYTCVPKMTIIWYVYGSWDIKLDRQNFLSFWTVFWPFTTQKIKPNFNNPKNQNFEKLKKMLGDIIISHKCTKNHDHMLYYSLLDMVHNRCNCYFSFWAIFCSLTSLTAQKNKIKKNEKSPRDIIILQ